MSSSTSTTPQGRLFEQVLAGLRRIGYKGELLQESYRFEDWFSAGNLERVVDAAAFAQTPLSIDNACFAVVISRGKSGPELISDYRSLGAPRAFEILPDRVLHWRVGADPAAKTRPLVLRPDEIAEAFRVNEDVWRPESILRVKNIGPVEPRQRDFIDLGLMPALEQHIRTKLDPVLRGAFYEATEEHRRRNRKYPDPDRLCRLVFRALAGKVMHDRDWGPFGSMSPADPDALLAEVARYYNDNQPTVSDTQTRRAVMERLWGTFSFRNLSAESLAFVWENTFVDKTVRKRLGIHATPPSIARYVVRHLPLDKIPEEQRRVVEPCCGSGVFLLAALQRLRELLKRSMGPEERHDYYRKMLSGFDIETFSLEAARYCLMLADFPNPNGWNLVRADVFDEPDQAPRFHAALAEARVVLCNPPFETFRPGDRRRYRLSSVRKPVELLGRVLDHLPPGGLLGFVLPLQLLSGQGYEAIRRRLAERYKEIEVVSLPDEVFAQAEHETALLIAQRPRDEGTSTAFLHRKVLDGGWPAFNAYHRVAREDAGSKTVDEAAQSFAIVDLQEVWSRLSRFSTVGDATGGQVHRGIEWNVSLKDNRHLLISKTAKPGFKKGIPSAHRGGLRSYQCPPVRYLCVKPEYRLYDAFDLPWESPKVVMNAKRKSRSPWRIAAFADESGLVCYQTFTALWPSGDWTPTLLAAVLNAPLANAFIAAHEGTRDITVEMIKEIPVPRLDRRLRERIETLVAEYIERVETIEFEAGPSARAPRRILAEIDAAVLAGYALPARLERRLLDYFNGYGGKRPVPFNFGDYFPADFRPYFSLADYLSEGFGLSTAGEARSRYKPAPENVLDALGVAVDAYGE